jgi:GNAT superfamily N-acetyltransferase
VRRYDHIGIPTNVARDGEVHLPQYGLHCTDHETNPFGVQWMRYDADSPLPEVVRTMPHVAFEVDDLATELEGREVIIAPNSPSEGVTVAFVLEDGAPVELMQFAHVYTLVPVVTDEQWTAFHDIRWRVLFVDRGETELTYDPNHPDDRRPENHPMLLRCNGVSVGALRVDVVAGRGVAIMRMVAVASRAQRRGHGRRMLALAEDFARECGCSLSAAFAAADAVGFYARCGYRLERWDPEETFGGGVQMAKRLES